MLQFLLLFLHWRLALIKTICDLYVQTRIRVLVCLCVSVCVTCSATTTHLFVPLPPQRRLNLTKTVRKTAISNDLQKVGGVTVDNIKHDPKYDEEGLYVSCWAGCLGLN